MSNVQNKPHTLSPLEAARNKKPRRLSPYSHINITLPENATQEDRDEAALTWKILRRYFRQFANVAIEKDSNMLIGGAKCLGCDMTLGGLLGTFKWGIAYGEGTCSNCGYPCRAHHHIKDDTGNDILHIGPAILQYHPDELEELDP